MAKSNEWQPKSLVRTEILGCPVSVVPTGEVADYGALLGDRIKSAQGSQVITFNPEMAMMARQDPAFAQILAAATWTIPDGAGVVWALRNQGIPAHRCPGIELAEWLIDKAAQEDWRVACVGGKPEVMTAAVAFWHHRWPTLSLWAHHGYIAAEHLTEVVDSLAAFQPQIVLVGLGSPRQEQWIQQYKATCPQALWMGVGGSFDIWGGQKDRAPQWWRDHHMEWLYRLYQEPWRWRRMLALPHFVWQVLRDP